MPAAHARRDGRPMKRFCLLRPPLGKRGRHMSHIMTAGNTHPGAAPQSAMGASAMISLGPSCRCFPGFLREWTSFGISVTARLCHTPIRWLKKAGFPYLKIILDFSEPVGCFFLRCSLFLRGMRWATALDLWSDGMYHFTRVCALLQRKQHQLRSVPGRPVHSCQTLIYCEETLRWKAPPTP